MEQLANLEQLMKNHDWTYHYSDDHRVWRRGEESSARLTSAMQTLKSQGLEQQVQALWEQYCPWSETNGGWRQ